MGTLVPSGCFHLTRADHTTSTRSGASIKAGICATPDYVSLRSTSAAMEIRPTIFVSTGCAGAR